MRPILLVLLCGTVAHGDVAVSTPARMPHTPLGPQCDAALALAQQDFTHQADGIHFRVKERVVSGVYRWSDMCGVWGEYTVELRPRSGPDRSWKWKTWKVAHGEGDDETVVGEAEGSRQARGWQARILMKGDPDTGVSWPSNAFVDAFRPALDACLK